MQSALRIQAVSNPDGGLAGDALVTGGTDQLQSNGVLGVENDRPQSGMEKVGAGVEVVGAFVGLHPDGHIPQREGAAADAVGIAAHHAAQEAGALPVAVGILAAKHYVGNVPVFVGNQQTDQGGTVVGDGCGELTAGYGVQEGFFPGGQNAESFLHKNAPFDF